MKTYMIPAGTAITLRLPHGMTFDMPDEADRDTVELHASELIRNSGDMVYSLTVREVANGGQ